MKIMVSAMMEFALPKVDGLGLMLTNHDLFYIANQKTVTR